MASVIENAAKELVQEINLFSETRSPGDLDKIRSKMDKLKKAVRDAEDDECDKQYRDAAKEHKHVWGELEIDDDAVVSSGGDKGAYVAAWVWVSDEEAGFEDEDDEEEDDGHDLEGEDQEEG